MVGAKHSKGCKTCIRRKVRCDRQKPYCKRCMTSKRACEGYRDLSDKGCSSSEGSVSPVALKPITLGLSSSKVSKAIMANDFVTEYARRSSLTMSTLTSLGLLGSTLVEKSLQSVAMAYFGRVRDLPAVKEWSRDLYAESLGQLQACLEHPKHCLADSTLACTVILAMFEVISATSTAQRTWELHVQGYLQLHKIRGPIQMSNPVSRNIYTCFREMCVISCIVRQQATFLAEPEWKVQEADPYNSLLNIMIDIPGVLQTLNGSRNKNSTENPAYFQLLQIRDDLIEWKAGTKLNVWTIPSPDLTCPSPFSYEASDISVINCIALFSAAMIIVNKRLVQPIADEYTSESMALQVCTCVSMFKKSLFGKFSLLFPLATAADAFPQYSRYRTWCFDNLRSVGEKDCDMGGTICEMYEHVKPRYYIPEVADEMITLRSEKMSCQPNGFGNIDNFFAPTQILI